MNYGQNAVNEACQERDKSEIEIILSEIKTSLMIHADILCTLRVRLAGVVKPESPMVNCEVPLKRATESPLGGELNSMLQSIHCETDSLRDIISRLAI